MRPFLSTYSASEAEEWARDVDVLRPRAHGRVQLLRGLVAAAPGRSAAILRGAVGLRDGYVDILAATLIARRDTPVLIAEATWELGSRALTGGRRTPAVDRAPRHGRRTSRALIRAVDHPDIHYGVLSTEEGRTFPEVWGIDPARVHVTPFCVTAAPDAGEAGARSGVFAGGDSLRDYRPLLAAAQHIKSPITIATRMPVPTSVAANVTAGPLAPQEYARRAPRAAVVVIPLIPGTTRSAGQQTYLNAMAAGQDVVVTDAPGVRDYVTHDETGLIVAADDPGALADAVNGLLEDEAKARALGAAARERVAADFGRAAYFRRLLAVARSIARTDGAGAWTT